MKKLWWALAGWIPPENKSSGFYPHPDADLKVNRGGLFVPLPGVWITPSVKRIAVAEKINSTRTDTLHPRTSPHCDTLHPRTSSHCDTRYSRTCSKRTYTPGNYRIFCSKVRWREQPLANNETKDKLTMNSAAHKPVRLILNMWSQGKSK